MISKVSPSFGSKYYIDIRKLDPPLAMNLFKAVQDDCPKIGNPKMSKTLISVKIHDLADEDFEYTIRRFGSSRTNFMKVV
ncbi:MAG: hypothetical protein PHV68_09515 [Candidatus Gastranaerophilales bacterium]|nr:hypothetical protein [Candidatus Gastranaerophilales bacterium]